MSNFITWENIVNFTLQSNSTLAPAGTNDVWSCFANSIESVASGRIRVEMKMNTLSNPAGTGVNRILGISTRGDALSDYSSVDFGLFPFNNALYAIQNSSVINLGVGVAIDDILAVEITADNKVKYFKNADVVGTVDSPTLNYPYNAVAVASGASTLHTLAECKIDTFPVTADLILEAETITFTDSISLEDTVFADLILDADSIEFVEAVELEDTLDYADLILDAEIIDFNDSIDIEGTEIGVEYADLILQPESINVVDFALIEDQTQPQTKLLIDVALQKAACKPTTSNSYRARLVKVSNGQEIPITSFREDHVFSEIAGTLQVNLGSWGLVHNLSKTDKYRFEMGIKVGSVYLYENWGVFELASSSGSADPNNPQGSTTVYFVDELVNKAMLAPTNNIILFNPSLIPAPDISSDELIFDEYGNAITTTVQSVKKLSLNKLLEKIKVYLSLDNIVCSFPDFPISRINFTIENGYFDALINILHDYEPAYSIYNNVLYIYDTAASFSGVIQKIFQQTEFDPEISKAKGANVGGVKVNYRDITSGGSSIIPGSFGWKYTIEDSESSPGDGTTRRTQTYLALWCDLNTNRIIKKNQLYQYTTVSKAFGIVSIIETYFNYDSSGNKIGSETRTQQLIPVADTENTTTNVLREVSYETESVLNATDLDGSVYQKENSRIKKGLMLYRGDLAEQGQLIPKMNLIDAVRNKEYDPLDPQQTTNWEALSSEVSSMQSLGGQSTINLYKYDAASDSSNEKNLTVPGSTKLGQEFGQFKESSLVIRSNDYPNSKIVSITLGETDANNAKLQGKRKLKRLNDPPRRISLKLPFLDSSIRIGTVFQPVMKFPNLSALGYFMCDGYTREGTNLGTQDQFISMQVNGVELLNADGSYGGLSFETTGGNLFNQITHSLSENEIGFYTAKFDVPESGDYKLILDALPVGYSVKVRQQGVTGAFQTVNATTGISLPDGANGTTLTYNIQIVANSTFAENFSRNAVNLCVKPSE